MALPNLVRKWIRYGLDDLKIAKSIESMGTSYWRGAAYHSQQSVEKVLKGYLAYKQVRPPKTHDISVLLKLVAGIDAPLAKSLASATRLTKYAIEYRYPDAAKRPMTRTKAGAATKIAAKTFEIISDALRS